MTYKGPERRNGDITNAHIHHAVGHNTALIEKISTDLTKMNERIESLEGSRNRVRGAGGLLAFLVTIIGLEALIGYFK